MKYNTLLTTVISFFVLLTASCTKTKGDKSDIYIGNYPQLTGSAKFADDRFGQYDQRNDTASMIISKNSKSDSANYIYIQGVMFAKEPIVSVSLNFVNNGTAIVAYVTDTAFVIPRQNPFSGSDMSVEGSGSIKNGKLVLNYRSSFRTDNKYSIVTQD